MKNIVTIFSGRKKNMEILCKYLQKALDLQLIDEVHFWNNTRNIDDENYVKSISNLKRTSSKNHGHYIQIFTPIINNEFNLNVKASNDIHIKLCNDCGIEYEIVLGGWYNTNSVVRRNKVDVFNLLQLNVAEGENEINIRVKIEKSQLLLYKNNEILIHCNLLDDLFFIENVYFKTGYTCVGNIRYETTQNHHFYFMDTCEKNWVNYYNYYDSKEFKNDVILKCDDDIVFIDLLKLPKFIDYVKKSDYDLVFANTINNSVCAYFQQNKYDLIPKEFMELEYPHLGFRGTLWESGAKAEKLHHYFLENKDSFLNYEYNDEIIPITTRFSINFFGYKGKNWYKIINAGYDPLDDDERILTVDYLEKYDFKNVVYSDFYVSHLSFFRQLETAMNVDDLINKYHKLYCTIHEK